MCPQIPSPSHISTCSKSDLSNCKCDVMMKSSLVFPPLFLISQDKAGMFDPPEQQIRICDSPAVFEICTPGVFLKMPTHFPVSISLFWHYPTLAAVLYNKFKYFSCNILSI